MRKPIDVRPVTAAEQQALTAGLRSSEAFVLRRCQIVLASAGGEHARLSADRLGCDDQTVRNVIHRFTTDGLAVLTPGSSAPHRTPHAVFTPARREQVRALLHQSPRTFGKPPGVWTLDVAAEVASAEGITPRQVSGETIRTALAQLKVRWKRAKHWITSPDPAYAQQQTARPPDPPRRPPPGLGARL
jgi:transposase